MDEIMVYQWSFCPECKGRGPKGCPGCGGRKTIVNLIPLESIPKNIKVEYASAQADFIQRQKEGQDE